MAVTDDVLRTHARRAYERGRAEAGLRAALWAVPVGLASVVACGLAADTLAGSTALAAVLAGFVWRGEDLGRGVRPGLLAGVPALVLPLVVQAGRGLDAELACALLPWACVAGGLGSGLLVTRLTADAARERPRVRAAAVLVAGLAGCMGCLVAGTVGLLAMAAGLVAGAAPAWPRRA